MFKHCENKKKAKKERREKKRNKQEDIIEIKRRGKSVGPFHKRQT